MGRMLGNHEPPTPQGPWAETVLVGRDKPYLRAIVARALLREIPHMPFQNVQATVSSDLLALTFSVAASVWGMARDQSFDLQKRSAASALAGAVLHHHQNRETRTAIPHLTSLLKTALAVGTSRDNFKDEACEALTIIDAMRNPGWDTKSKSGWSDVTGNPGMLGRKSEVEKDLKFAERGIEVVAHSLSIDGFISDGTFPLEVYLKQRSEHWGVWFEWYRRRLYGALASPAVEFVYYTMPAATVSRGAKALEVNTAIYERLLAITQGAPDTRSHEPPPLPQQRGAPYFSVREDGVLDLAPPDALDIDGNNQHALRDLHPQLCEAARSLVAVLQKSTPTYVGNPAYGALLDRAKPYLATVDRPLDDVSFGKLYAEGVRLENAATATEAAIAQGELPPLSDNESEPLMSLLALHGSFIISTAAGSDLLFAERNYKRGPEQDREYRNAAMSFAQQLAANPEIMAPDAAALVANAAEEIGAGANPSRSSVVGERVTTNAAIGLVGIATIVAVPVTIASALGGAMGMLTAAALYWPLNEALKRTEAVSQLNSLLAKGFDRLTQDKLPQVLMEGRRIVSPHVKFVLRIAPDLRRLAAYNGWINRSLDWLEQVEREAEKSAALGEGLFPSDH
jgi:hypothetical protein